MVPENPDTLQVVSKSFNWREEKPTAGEMRKPAVNEKTKTGTIVKPKSKSKS